LTAQIWRGNADKQNLGDDAAEIPAAADDNAFLEEEGEADVSGIVRTPGEES
jgi:hypothetical protein